MAFLKPLNTMVLWCAGGLGTLNLSPVMRETQVSWIAKRQIAVLFFQAEPVHNLYGKSFGIASPSPPNPPPPQS